MPKPGANQPSRKPIPQPPDSGYRQRPRSEAGRDSLSRFPDGRARQCAPRITHQTHKTTVIQYNTYIQQNVFAYRGWYPYAVNGIYYYHHPTYYGMIGVAYGNLWFWTYWHNNNWWWHHPHYNRWLVWRNDQWWYWNDGGYWSIWREDTDNFYIVKPDRIETEVPSAPPPTQPAPPEQETMFPSDDGTLVVNVLGKDKLAHLYTYPGLDHIAFLGEGAADVEFGHDPATDELYIRVKFADGTVKYFDKEGDLFGDQDEPSGETTGPIPADGVQKGIEKTPPDLGKLPELPAAPALPSAGPANL